MKKILSLLSILIIISIILSGCSYSFKSVNELIRPPMLNGENSYLQNAFQSVVGTDMQMISPSNGDYRSSYLIYDLNNDGKDEAFVFYSEPLGDNNVNIAFFTQNNDEWFLTDTITEAVSEIYEISFADINGNNNKEILISFFNSTDNASTDIMSQKENISLNIYNYNGTNLTLQKTENYNKLYLADLNADNSTDFLLFLTDIDEETNDLRTLGKYISFNSDYSLSNESSFFLYYNIEILNITTDILSDKDIYTRIYIDSLVGENSIVTNVFYLNQETNELFNIFKDDDSLSDTLRMSRVYSKDVDLDGIVEIPTIEALPGGIVINSDSDNTQLNLVLWSQIVDGNIEVKYHSLYNNSQKYMFIFPESWLNNYSARYNYINQTLTIYRLYDNKDIFAIKSFPTSSWDDYSTDFTKIKSNDIYTYGYRIINDETKDFINTIYSNFIVIE